MFDDEEDAIQQLNDTPELYDANFPTSIFALDIKVNETITEHISRNREKHSLNETKRS